MDQILRELVDRNAIHEVITRYCRGLDRLDEALLRSCFHEDSEHDHLFVGASSLFCGFALDLLRDCLATHHQLGAISIAVQGDTADAESYFTAYHRVGDPPPAAFSDAAGMDVIIAGRYIDRFERRNDEWRIARRTGVHDWRRYEAAADRGFFDLPEDQRGRRDRRDPVYSRGRA